MPRVCVYIYIYNEIYFENPMNQKIYHDKITLSTVVLHCCSAFEKNQRLYVSFLAFSSLSMYYTAVFAVVNKIEEESRMHESCTRV